MEFYQGSKELSDLVIVNFAGLREQCLTRYWQEVDQEGYPPTFTRAERKGIDQLFLKAAAAFQRDRARQLSETQGPDEDPVDPATIDWRESTGLAIVERDLDHITPDIPKWLLLATWCCPESVAGSCPELVKGLVVHALKNSLKSIS